MKKLNLFSIVFALLAIFIFSCEGPVGPAGEDGVDGIDGIAGTDGAPGTDGAAGADGTDGVDGNAVCLTCHNLAVKTAITADYIVSVHGLGGAVGYAGSRNDCAMCHSHEGFVETQFTGSDTTAAGFSLPQPIQCASCHSFHSTLDFSGDGTDYALRTSDEVTLVMDGVTTIDFEGNSNLCINCHQPRSVGPVADVDGNYLIDAHGHYGPHNGPQSTVVEGIGGYEVAGTVSYPTSQSGHRSSASCIKCHMGASTVEGEGGHTWNVSLSGCLTCHSSATDFDVNGKQTAVLALMTTLKEKLTTAGLLDVDGDIVEALYPVDEVGALWNYKTVLADRSNGVHNPKYVTALLQNSIEVFP